MDYNINGIKQITSNEEILEVLNPVPNFTSKDDIKPWVHDKLEPRGINLVIERSDASKIVFKCKNLYRKSSTPRSTTTKIINGKQVTKRIRRSIPEDSCPFRLRVSYSVKHKNWMVNIIKHEHSASLCSNNTLCGASPIDHAQVSAATQYGNQGLSSNKRSYYTATFSTNISSSPNSSIPSPYTTNSPAVSSTLNTPHEFSDYEPSFKKPRSQLSSCAPRQFNQSPLFNETDTLEHSFIAASHQNQSSSLHDDLKYAYEESGTGADSFDPYDDFSTTLANFDFPNESMFKKYISSSSNNASNPSVSTASLFDTTENPMSDSSMSLEAQLFNGEFLCNDTMKPTSNMPTRNSLNIKQEGAQASSVVDNDPLMYLLSSTNSNYSFEELENLDKAMGIDANDKILMSMFGGSI